MAIIKSTASREATGGRTEHAVCGDALISRSVAIDLSRRLRRERLGEGDPGEALVRAVRAVASAPAAGGVVDERAPEADPALLEGGVRRPLHDVLARAQEAGEVRADVPTETLLSSLGALLQGHVAIAASSSRAEVLTAIFLDAVRYRPGREAGPRRPADDPEQRAPRPVGQRLRHRIAVTLALAAVALVPWLLILARTLPDTHGAVHWRATWIGFDLGLAAVLIAVAHGVERSAAWLPAAAAAAAALLVADAWFDSLTAAGGGELTVALAMAAFVELPLAIGCFAIARLASANPGTAGWAQWLPINARAVPPRAAARTLVAGR